MNALHVELEEDLVSLLQMAGQSPQQAAREFIVLELYRRGRLSSGVAAARLGMERIDFIRHASRLGLPFFDLSVEEWEEEKLQAGAL